MMMAPLGCLVGCGQVACLLPLGEEHATVRFSARWLAVRRGVVRTASSDGFSDQSGPVAGGSNAEVPRACGAGRVGRRWRSAGRGRRRCQAVSVCNLRTVRVLKPVLIRDDQHAPGAASSVSAHCRVTGACARGPALRHLPRRHQHPINDRRRKQRRQEPESRHVSSRELALRLPPATRRRHTAAHTPNQTCQRQVSGIADRRREGGWSCARAWHAAGSGVAPRDDATRAGALGW